MNMIEKVASAIHEKRRNPDANKHWFHENAEKCELSMQLAKAALEAMREPTPEMLEAATGWYDHVAADETYPMARGVMRAAVGAALEGE